MSLIEKDGDLCREWNGPRSRECRGEHGEAGEVGVQLHLRQPANPQRLQAVLVLEPSEGALNRAPAPVKIAPPLRLAEETLWL